MSDTRPEQAKSQTSSWLSLSEFSHQSHNNLAYVHWKIDRCQQLGAAEHADPEAISLIDET